MERLVTFQEKVETRDIYINVMFEALLSVGETEIKK
jgi:hypothetical protein